MTLIDSLLDSAEITLSCAYAVWLYTHKNLEPKMTWAEVGFGVGYTLAFSHIRGVIHGGTWRDQSLRTIHDFLISAPPIIVGELLQELETRQDTQGIEKEYPR